MNILSSELATRTTKSILDRVTAGEHVTSDECLRAIDQVIAFSPIDWGYESIEEREIFLLVFGKDQCDGCEEAAEVEHYDYQPQTLAGKKLRAGETISEREQFEAIAWLSTHTNRDNIREFSQINALSKTIAATTP